MASHSNIISARPTIPPRIITATIKNCDESLSPEPGIRQPCCQLHTTTIHSTSQKGERAEPRCTMVWTRWNHHLPWLIKHQSHSFKRRRSRIESKETIRKLQDELYKEKKKHQFTRKQLFQQGKILECRICCTQPDRWLTLSCGHMLCLSCKNRLGKPKKCSMCRSNSLWWRNKARLHTVL